MVKIFAKNLSKKNVMSSDGSILGALYNVVIDIRTGELINLLWIGTCTGRKGITC